MFCNAYAYVTLWHKTELLILQLQHEKKSVQSKACLFNIWVQMTKPVLSASFTNWIKPKSNSFKEKINAKWPEIVNGKVIYLFCQSFLPKYHYTESSLLSRPWREHWTHDTFWGLNTQYQRQRSSAKNKTKQKQVQHTKTNINAELFQMFISKYHSGQHQQKGGKTCFLQNILIVLWAK